jgi:hypothetical protein
MISWRHHFHFSMFWEICCPSEGHFEHEFHFFTQILKGTKRWLLTPKLKNFLLGSFRPIFFLLVCKKGVRLKVKTRFETPSRFQLGKRCKGKFVSPELFRMKMKNLASWTTLQQLKRWLWATLLSIFFLLPIEYFDEHLHWRDYKFTLLKNLKGPNLTLILDNLLVITWFRIFGAL